VDNDRIYSPEVKRSFLKGKHCYNCKAELTPDEIIKGDELLTKLTDNTEFEGWVHCNPTPDEVFDGDKVIFCKNCNRTGNNGGNKNMRNR